MSVLAFPLRGQVVYVDASVAGGLANGSSWANAYSGLVPALSAAGSDTQIWVARGTYQPAGPGGDRNATFTLAYNRLALYGGFTNGMASLAQRSPALYPTILSGDLNGDDAANWGNRGDNAYNVLRLRNDSFAPNGNVLDGFVIRGGHADLGDGSPNSYGGGLSVYNSLALRVANCVFTDNSADGCGGLYLRRSSLATVSNCVFSGNRATVNTSNFGAGAAGLAAQAGAYSASFYGCRFAGNSSAFYGGAFYSSSTAITNRFRNCLFAGNYAATGESGALHLRAYPSEIVNCTLSRNAPSAIWSQGMPAAPGWTNLIVWANVAELTGYSPRPVLTYSDVMWSGGVGTGNVDADPRFVLATSRTWTASAVYSSASGQTQLTDSQARWPAGRLAGGTVNPDTAQALHFYIATNTATSLLVWGDATAGSLGDTYELYDWHLQTNSPCVDTGHPTMDWSQEPDYPNGQLDMGAYGNTGEAASTNLPPGEPMMRPSGFTLQVR